VGEDQDELYKQEREMALKEAQEKEDTRKQAIPGLVKPQAFERANDNGLNFEEEEEDDL
jgi:hypothetical protein